MVHGFISLSARVDLDWSRQLLERLQRISGKTALSVRDLTADLLSQAIASQNQQTRYCYSGTPPSALSGTASTVGACGMPTSSRLEGFMPLPCW